MIDEKAWQVIFGADFIAYAVVKASFSDTIYGRRLFKLIDQCDLPRFAVLNLLLSVSLFNNQKTVDYPLGVWIGTGYTIQFDNGFRANDSIHRDYIKCILKRYVNASFIYSFILCIFI